MSYESDDDLDYLSLGAQKTRTFIRKDGSYGRIIVHRHSLAGKFPYPAISSYVFSDPEDLRSYYDSLAKLAKGNSLKRHEAEMMLIRGFDSLVESDFRYTIINVDQALELRQNEVDKLFRRWLDKLDEFVLLYQSKRRNVSGSLFGDED